MKNLARITLRQLAAQRHNASHAARPMLTSEQKAQATYHAMRAAIDAGDVTTARALAIELRPLLGFMPEGN